jgi:PAS domain-containing protein
MNEKRSATVSAGIDLEKFGLTLARETPDGIIYADAEGLIRFWNHGAERIFRFGEAEALGKSLDLIIPQNLRKRHWDGYAETMRSGRTRYGVGTSLQYPRFVRMARAFRSSLPSSPSETGTVA